MSAVFVATYARAWKPWFHVHVGLQVLTVLLTTGAFTAIYLGKSAAGDHHFDMPHEVSGRRAPAVALGTAGEGKGSRRWRRAQGCVS